MEELVADNPDPTLVRNQPAIRSGHRRRWLIPAGLLAAVTSAFFTAAYSIQTVVSTIGIVVMVVLYVVMVLVAITVRAVRPRNIAFAWIMSVMAAAALALLFVLLLTEPTQR